MIKRFLLFLKRRREQRIKLQILDCLTRTESKGTPLSFTYDRFVTDILGLDKKPES